MSNTRIALEAVSIIFPLFILGASIMALAALFAFGGARRNAVAHLATGSYMLLFGAILLAGLASSYYARQDNAYFFNLAVGAWYLLIGSTLTIGALAGFGLNGWGAAALCVLNLVVLYLYFAVSRPFTLAAPNGGAPIVIYAVALVALALLFVASRGAWRRLRVVLKLTGAALLLTLVFYALNGNLGVYAHLAENDHGLTAKPPILGEGVLGLIALLLCTVAPVVLFLLGRRWQRVEIQRIALPAQST